MDNQEFEDVVQRLKAISDVIASLDESIRVQAFAVLKPYADGTPTKVRAGAETPPQNGSDGVSRDVLVDPEVAAAFMEQHVSDKPSDNVKAIAALIYSIYGNVEFSTAEVNEIAHEVGMTVPDRVDVTLSGASVDKRALFQKRRSGVYRPTVHGRTFFKDVYGVTQGTAKRPELT